MHIKIDVVIAMKKLNRTPKFNKEKIMENKGSSMMNKIIQVIIAVVLVFLLIYLHMHPALAILIAAVSGLFMRRQP